MKVTKGPLNATSKGESKKRKAGNSGESPEQRKLNSEIALSLGSIDKKLDDFRAEFRTENKKLREQLKDLKATQPSCQTRDCENK